MWQGELTNWKPQIAAGPAWMSLVKSHRNVSGLNSTFLFLSYVCKCVVYPFDLKAPSGEAIWGVS